MSSCPLQHSSKVGYPPGKGSSISHLWTRNIIFPATCKWGYVMWSFLAGSSTNECRSWVPKKTGESFRCMYILQQTLTLMNSSSFRCCILQCIYFIAKGYRSIVCSEYLQEFWLHPMNKLYYIMSPPKISYETLVGMQVQSTFSTFIDLSPCDHGTSTISSSKGWNYTRRLEASDLDLPCAIVLLLDTGTTFGGVILGEDLGFGGWRFWFEDVVVRTSSDLYLEGGEFVSLKNNNREWFGATPRFQSTSKTSLSSCSSSPFNFLCLLSVVARDADKRMVSPCHDDSVVEN